MLHARIVRPPSYHCKLIKINEEFKKRLFEHYLKINKNIKLDKFKNDFEILSVLRNLKIIGIFTRLAKRDKKRKYLKLIPYAWKLIDNRIKNNPNFHDLKNFLQKNPRIKKI